MYILGVERYTDVTVRYVPRFGGQGSITFWYNRKKKSICSVSFHFFEQKVVQIFKKNPPRCENTKYYYIVKYIKPAVYTYKE